MSQEHFSRIADEEGWSETTQITVLLRYIENQHSTGGIFPISWKANARNRLPIAFFGIWPPPCSNRLSYIARTSKNFAPTCMT